MGNFYRNANELIDNGNYKNQQENLSSDGFFNGKYLFTKTIDNNKNNNNNSDSNIEDDDRVDINTEERENVKEIRQYQQYQESQQNQQPWSDSSDIRIVDSD